VPGRWVQPSVLKVSLASVGASIFGMASDPYVWQPYDCTLEWWSNNEARRWIDSVVRRKQFLFVGTSRERTLYYDFANAFDNARESETREKHDLSCGNMYFFNAIYDQRVDADQWNVNGGEMKAWPAQIRQLLVKYDLCGNASVPSSDGSLVSGLFKLFGGKRMPKRYLPPPVLHIYLCSEEMRMVDNAFASQWDNIIRNFISFWKTTCPRAVIHLATSPAVLKDQGSLSWQRMLMLSRRSRYIATHEFGLPVIDSFSLSLPLAADPLTYPDGLHLFTNGTISGNHVRYVHELRTKNCISMFVNSRT
jgi:hypothetical protein